MNPQKMKVTKLKMLLFAFIPMAMQAQPAVNNNVAGKVPLTDLSLLVFAVAALTVFFVTRKKKQVV